jgi:hypothetical protein
VALDRIPGPAEASEDAVYVADLVPDRDDRPAAAIEAEDRAARSGS